MLHFFYGTLRDQALLTAVLGHPVSCRPAVLDGYQARTAMDADGGEQSYPVLVATAGAQALGVVADLDDGDGDRLSWYELGYQTLSLPVTLADGTVRDAAVSVCGDRWQAGRAWSFEDWSAKWAAVCLRAAPEYMALMGRVTPQVAHIRYPMILMRAASALRAQSEPSVAQMRFNAVASDIKIISQDYGYTKFFSVEDYRLEHRVFSGTMSKPLDRAVFVSGDATVVLPYDPVRDRVLLIEQIRMAPLARGARNPWQLEAIAGRVDPAESPADTARREAGEEAGIAFGELIPAPHFYPSSGALSEYVYCFVAIADLPDGVAGTGGLESEGEDIRSHLMPFGELMRMIDTGEVENGPLIILALWLAARREGLRHDAITTKSP